MTPGLARIPMVALPHEASCGPAMKELNENQRGFVVAMVEMAVANPTDAARIAGYGGTYQATRVAAKRLMGNPAIMAALREEADKYMRGSVMLAAKTLEAICLDKDHKDRFKAATELLNRANLIVKTTHEVIVTDNRVEADVVAQIVEIARRTGQDPKALLGYDPKLPAVDATFEEMSSVGLEDVL